MEKPALVFRLGQEFTLEELNWRQPAVMLGQQTDRLLTDFQVVDGDCFPEGYCLAAFIRVVSLEVGYSEEQRGYLSCGFIELISSGGPWREPPAGSRISLQLSSQPRNRKKPHQTHSIVLPQNSRVERWDWHAGDNPDERFEVRQEWDVTEKLGLLSLKETWRFDPQPS